MSTKLLKNNEERPLPEALYPGLKLPIFLQQDDGTHRYECKAILVEKLDSLVLPEPYPYIEYSETKVINAVKEKWKVKMTSGLPFNNGRELIRWIPRYHSEGVIKIKELDQEDWIFEDGDDNDYMI